MRFSFSRALVALCLTMTPVAASGQASDPTITFTMPLNLTNVPSDIEKVAIYCRIQSSALLTRNNEVSAQVEFLVKGGQVIDMAHQLITSASLAVVATNLDPNALGKQATYECSLTGFSTSLRRWDMFQATHADPAFRMSPTPAPLSGSFVW
jgi:hypothetical protein